MEKFCINAVALYEKEVTEASPQCNSPLTEAPFSVAIRSLSSCACTLLMFLKPFINPPGKADRLKQAKQEAEKEIKAYKAQREEQFQKRMSDVRTAT